MIKITNEALGKLGNPCRAATDTFHNQEGKYPHQCGLITTAVCNNGGCLPDKAKDYFGNRPGLKLSLETINTLSKEISAQVPPNCRMVVDGHLCQKAVSEQADVERITRGMLTAMVTFLAKR